MRVNLRRSRLKGVLAPFFKEMINEFAEEYDFGSVAVAQEYVMTGAQGLHTFVEFIASKGYSVTAYHLEPNKDLYSDVGENWSKVSRTSPSYGFVIADDCPKWVEFKLKNG